METRARYVIIGTFVLAVIFAGFGFVYWLKNTGGLGDRAYYRIRFEHPVSGLGPGSAVLFNGLRVGTVQNLTVDPADLRGLVANISVVPWTPIHADTKIEVTFQGLTGSPAILLRGGTPDSPRVTAKNGQIPIIDAPGNVGRNLNDSARDTLANINRVIDENSKPLHSAVTGISTFADMLGRNSKKIEGMLDGLDKMLGGGKAKEGPKTYDLAAATKFPAFEKTIKVQMAVPDVHAILAYDTQKILIRSQAGTFSDVADGRWADNLPKLMQAKLIESYENAQLLGQVSRPFDMLEAPYRLEITIRNFQISLTPEPQAVVEFAARILADKGQVVDARIFKAAAPAKSTKAAEAVPALDQAFTKAASELVAWSVEKLSAAAAGDGSGKADDMDMKMPDGDGFPPPPPPGGSVGKRPPKGAMPPPAKPASPK